MMQAHTRPAATWICHDVGSAAAPPARTHRAPIFEGIWTPNNCSPTNQICVLVSATQIQPDPHFGLLEPPIARHRAGCVMDPSAPLLMFCCLPHDTRLPVLFYHF